MDILKEGLREFGSFLARQSWWKGYIKQLSEEEKWEKENPGKNVIKQLGIGTLDGLLPGNLGSIGKTVSTIIKGNIKKK